MIVSILHKMQLNVCKITTREWGNKAKTLPRRNKPNKEGNSSNIYQVAAVEHGRNPTTIIN